MKRTVNRAFTIVEIAVVLFLVGLLAGVGLYGLSTISERANQSVSNRSLEQVEMSQRVYFERNGNWTKEPGVLGGLRGVAVTTKASTGPDRVSIAFDWQRNLFLTVLDESGTCIVRQVPDPLSGSPAIVSTTTDSCDAASAANAAA